MTLLIRKNLIRSFVMIGLFAATVRAADAEFETKPAGPEFEKFTPRKAPVYTGPLLQAGDRLAIVGDSITEQKMYSRIIETYLTVCAPELNVSVRQFGWSGETAEGFLRRMESDCLRFKPTIVTLCYGMNDYKYKPYDESNAKWYREKYSEVVRNFKNAGARVVVGSPGCVGKVASWVKSASGTLEEHNLHLCKLRDIDIEIAAAEGVRFADNFWTMYTSGVVAKQKHGAAYEVAGKDGVHPGWAGHLIMAYDYLKALGVSGEIGTIMVDLKGASASATDGHQVKEFKDGSVSIVSSRYPFCATGEANSDGSIRSGMTLVPFNAELNRMTLIVKNAAAANYKVTWGASSKNYSAEQLAKGVNLAEDFAVNPFSEAFGKVDAAVLAKQTFETKQIKQIFHGKEFKADTEGTVKKTETERDGLVAAIKAAVVPVTHTIKIEAQQ